MEQLSPEALYLFSFLQSQKNIEGTYITNIDVLCENLYEVFGKKKTDIKRKVILSLKEISNKTNIVCEEYLKNSSYKNNDNNKSIVIYMEEYSGEHTQIKIHNIQSIRDIHLYYIFVCTSRWQNSQEKYFKCSFVRWSKLLNCTERTAKTKIAEAEKKKIIFINHGDYIDETSKKKHINLYSITPFPDEQLTISSKYKNSVNKNKFYEGILNYGSKSLFTQKGFEEYAEDVSEAIVEFSSYQDAEGKSHFPNDKAYITYAKILRRKKEHLLMVEENQLLEVAEVRLQKLKRNEGTKHIVEDKINKAKEEVKTISKNNDLFKNKNLRYTTSKPSNPIYIKGVDNYQIPIEASYLEDMFGED